MSIAEFKMLRIGLIMEPEPGNPQEVEGTLNPATARGRDGNLYLFPRLVAKGNYSRIGIARVLFNGEGDPIGVERMGIALEPEEEYEKRPGGGGCEDPRISFVEPLGCYLMSYTALSEQGPRVALAESQDLLHWKKLGLARFTSYQKVDLDDVDNKDSCLFPVAIKSPSGKEELAILHRPLFPGRRPEQLARHQKPHEIDRDRESIWISYGLLPHVPGEPHRLREFASSHRLAHPSLPWERLKIGIGPPPVLTKHGWLLVYHGVCESNKASRSGRKLTYSAGVMILSEADPRRILYRSPGPLLIPETEYETQGVVADVVFPTGIDRRDDIGLPDRFDVYYGMADDRIGVARLDLPSRLSVPLGDQST
jgi:predicted GH43/DUF377 family glycosyl hydrolase